MKRYEQVASIVYTFLSERPFYGTAQECATICGVSLAEFSRVALLSRSPEWVEKYGWTIPHRGHGAKIDRPWTVSHHDEDELNPFLRNGNRTKTKELEKGLRRNRAGLALEAKQTDARSLEGRKARFLHMQVEHALETLDFMSSAA